jgi:UDP-N-acetylglucosamine:LPS N-acetylglucosamine transferase
MESKNILIVTSDAGYGHRSAANAVAAAFEGCYGERATVTIANPLDDPRVPSFLRNAESDYDKLAREWPQFYKLGYKLSDMAMTTSATEMAYVVLIYDAMARLIRATNPDVIVVTFPTYQYPIQAYRRITGHNVPMATVVTDLVSLQRMWFAEGTDLFIMPSDVAVDLAVERGIERDIIHMTGLPVNPALADVPPSKAATREPLGWDPDLFTVLAVGSKRIEGLDAFTYMLNHSGFPLQIVAVAGGSDELHQAFAATEWHVPAHVYNFVSNMPDMLHAADCVLSKAGGLIVTESLACGLPMFIMQIIPGQETGNAQYMVDEGAGDVTLTPPDLLQAMAHWMTADRALYTERAANARRLGRPEAAYDAADLIWALALRGANARRPSRYSLTVEQMKELLRQFDNPTTT